MVIARVIMHDVVAHLRTRLVEWVFAAIMAMFSHRLLAAGDTFPSSPSYAYMALWMSEEHWGYCIGTVAGLRLLALTLNGSVDRLKPFTPAVRALTAWLSSSVWFCLAYGFYLSNPNATGWGTYGVILIADVCLAISISHEIEHPYRMRDAVARGR